MNDNLTTANTLNYPTEIPATSTNTISISTPVINTLKYDWVQNIGNNWFAIKDSNEITKTKEIVPEMVYLFTFADGTVIKTVCNKEDTFNFEYAFYLAIAKKLFSKAYTLDGVMHMVEELKYQKYYVKLVNKAIKNFYKEQKEEVKKLEEEKLKKERHKKFIEKKIAKKRKRNKRVE